MHLPEYFRRIDQKQRKLGERLLVWDTRVSLANFALPEGA